MHAEGKTTLIASLIGSALGTGAWLFGLGARLWPEHPQGAVFLLTLASTVLAMFLWPHDGRPGATGR